ncbi:FtsJ methyltransferase domain-containing protein 2 [Rhizophlyctis rosea]|nr:FtsJ methyltransferase domain-containing protein 2 [Rhizophlyctis rosea]
MTDHYSRDPEFIATLLHSPIPPPQLPPPSSQRNNEGNRRRDDYSNGRQPQPTQRYPSQPQQQPQVWSPYPSEPQPRVIYRADRAIDHHQQVQYVSNEASRDPVDWDKIIKVEVGKAQPVDYDQWCDDGIVQMLRDTKMKMLALPAAVLGPARSKSNPYEGIGKSVFVNRSAVKLANLDALFQLTDAHGRTGSTKGFRFADICAGPGGFTEYVLWRQNARNIDTRGWGMTLKGEQDFVLDHINAASQGRAKFVPCYGADGTGDIYKEENIKHFADTIKRETDEEGVDLVMADGGFSTAGDEWHQEEQSKQIMLCQVITMLLTLRSGGDFVLKTFDLFSPFMVDLIYILFRSFEKLTIIKPHSSRPANSERYIICKTLLPHSSTHLTPHLFEANKHLNALRPGTNVNSSHSEPQPGFQTTETKIAQGVADVLRLVDEEVVKGEKKFVDYVQDVNMKMSLKQTEALKELYKYAGDPSLPGWDQREIRGRCLRAWGLPDAEPQRTRHESLYRGDPRGQDRRPAQHHSSSRGPDSRSYQGRDRGSERYLPY